MSILTAGPAVLAAAVLAMAVLAALAPSGRLVRLGRRLTHQVRARQLQLPALPLTPVLDRHDLRTVLPSALRASMQAGFLERVFRSALSPEFLYGLVADSEPFEGRIGDTKTMTRRGLLTPTTTPVTPGSDAATGSYGVEQWTVTLDRYSTSLDTEMVASAAQIASQFVQDIQALGQHAGASLNQLARNRLYSAYAGGRTYATATSTSRTALAVDDVSGFQYVSVAGVLTAVSGSNPLTVTVNGVANTVTGVNTGTKTLTLGTAISASIGWAVVAANAPTSIRPGTAATKYALSGSDLVTLSLFRSAVARLRKMNVPTLGGYYVAHIDPDTEQQLFADSDFKQALTGRADSPFFQDLSLGRFAGIDWVRNTEAPIVTGGSSGTLTVHRPVVCGAGVLAATPFQGLADVLNGTGVEGISAVTTENVAPGVDVTLTVRPPQDRHGTKISSTWQWVGDYGVPTDTTAAVQGGSDPALYKRAVVIEHA